MSESVLWKSWQSEPALVTEAIEWGVHRIGHEALSVEQLTESVGVPTRYAKSWKCSSHSPPVVIVIVPPISLIEDQATKLKRSGGYLYHSVC